MVKKVLMCPPKYFSIAYEINPWMNTSNQVDTNQACREWEKLTENYKRLGIEVKLIEPNRDLPDLVFTANAGLVYKNIFFPSNFRFPERQPERQVFKGWFKSEGYRILELPKSLTFEGAGDALFCGDKLFLGYGFRSVKGVADFLSEYIKGLKIISLGLSNPYFYHLDTCLSPLPGGHFIYYPDAFDDQTRITLEKLGGFEISEELCINYGCNLVFIGNTTVTSYSDKSLEEVCNTLKLKIKDLKMTEFIKSGGGVRCLTLFL